MCSPGIVGIVGGNNRVIARPSRRAHSEAPFILRSLPTLKENHKYIGVGALVCASAMRVTATSMNWPSIQAIGRKRHQSSLASLLSLKLTFLRMAQEGANQDGNDATGCGQRAAMRRTVLFRLALPLGQLLLCAVLIVIVCGPRSLMPVSSTGTIYVKAENGVTERVSDGPARPAETPKPPDRRTWTAGRVLASIWLLNAPGSILTMKLAAYGSTHHGFMARVFDGFASSQLSGSLVALPFWWIAGRGADALLAMRRNVVAPRIHLPETAIAFLLLAGGVLFCILEVVAFFSDRAAPMILAAMALWTFLGGITVRARYKQRRIMQAAVSR